MRKFLWHAGKIMLRHVSGLDIESTFNIAGRIKKLRSFKNKTAKNVFLSRIFTCLIARSVDDTGEKL